MFIPKLEDLEKIVNPLIENGFDKENVKIKIEVDNEQTLRKINEDFFYKLNGNTINGEEIDTPEEVIINIGGITFEYVVKEEQEEIKNE